MQFERRTVASLGAARCATSDPTSTRLPETSGLPVTRAQSESWLQCGQARRSYRKPAPVFGKFAWTGPSMRVLTAIPYSPPRQNLFDHDCNPLAGGNAIHSTSQ